MRHEFRRALDRLEQNVAHEAVADRDVARAERYLTALNIADEIEPACVACGLEQRERFLFQIADDIGIFGIGAHLTNLFLVPIQHDEVVACVCKIHSKGIAESAEPDNTVNNVFGFILFSHDILLVLSDCQIPFGKTNALTVREIPERCHRERTETSDIHEQDGQ